MLWPPPPPDWTGVYDGACRLPELFEEFEEPDPLELEPELVEPEPVFAVPLPDVPLPDDELPARDAALELDELFDEVAVLCVEPGKTAATTPAAATLAKPTVAVAVFSRRRPRSRSATARERSRTALRRRSWLLMSVSLAHAVVEAVYEPSQDALIRAAANQALPRRCRTGIIDR